jgi:hypothetical protein
MSLHEATETSWTNASAHGNGTNSDTSMTNSRHSTRPQ